MRIATAALATGGALAAAAAPAGAASWSTYESLSNAPVIFPRAAIDDRGGAVVAFHRIDREGDRYVLRSSRIGVAQRPAGGRFGAPYELPGKNLFGFRLTSAPNGTTVLLYLDAGGCGAGTSCSGKARVSIARAGKRLGKGSVAGEGVRMPQLGIDSRGRPSVMWLSGHPSAAKRSLIVSDRRDGRWRRTTVARGGIFQATIGVGPRGDAIAVWSQDTGRRTSRGSSILRTRAAFRRPGGRFGRAAWIGPSGQISGPSAAVDRDGDALVTFTHTPYQENPGQEVVSSTWAFERRAGVGFGEGRELARRAGNGGISMDAKGAAVVNVTEQARHSDGLPKLTTKAVVRTAAGAWGAPEPVGPDGTFAVVDYGREPVAVVFGGRQEVGLRAFVRGSGGFAEEQQLSPTRWDIEPAIDANARGQAIVAWVTEGSEHRATAAIRSAGEAPAPPPPPPYAAP